jgi:hypothetical protein
MEKAYWLSRKRASLKLAQNAASSEARLIHYDLAGCGDRSNSFAARGIPASIEKAAPLNRCGLRVRQLMNR